MKELMRESIREPLKDTTIEEQVELIDYLRVIWRRRMLILLGTVFCVILAGAISFILPPVYEASAQVRIGRVWDKEMENPYLTKEMIGSDAFLDRVIGQLNLPITPYQMKKRKTIEVEVLEGGVVGQKLPLLLGIRVRAQDPQQAVDISNTVSRLLIEEHQRRFDEKLKEYISYEKEVEREVARIEEQITDLEKMVKKQLLNPSVNAPSVILLQAQLEQKTAQLLGFKKELRDTRINNASSIVTESSKLVAPPVLPKDQINPRIKLNMAMAGMLGFFISLLLGFFLGYLEKVRIHEST
ncbi:MAG: Wzz/FepE/Etk N-terminal domain-containing protein [Candidatus Manganitrophus sp. SA1]|nr:Wzz/FepE/Etk N-terminal domain-containing protein [Candidatus Manganitrophus morganii]